jgi:hypothetical protein
MQAAIPMCNAQNLIPNRAKIRNLTAEIREEWTLGQRHNRARLAILLQYQLLLRCTKNPVFQKVS